MSTFTRTDPPNPGWTYGETVELTENGRQFLAGAASGWHTSDPSQVHPLQTYSLLLSGVVPRPIAFISTRSENGHDNLAPYSYFTVVSSDPPVVSFSSTAHPVKGTKDSARNAISTKNFVVNIISEPWVHQAHATSIESPYGQEEWGFAGLTKVASEAINAPRVRESGFSMECEFLQNVPIIHPATSKVASEVIFGTVVRIHVRKDLLVFSPRSRMPQVDCEALMPICRLGDLSYATIGTAFRLPRPRWEEDEFKALSAAARRDIDDNLNTNGL